MLARALALNPRVLLLDDFTARVDTATERKILANVRANYPGITLLSVTQKIGPIEDYDQIVLLMEGEVLATGERLSLIGLDFRQMRKRLDAMTDSAARQAAIREVLAGMNVTDLSPLEA